ncbi:MAG: hypothetical protein V3T05_09700 [Myxococcota bacterium]
MTLLGLLRRSAWLLIFAVPVAASLFKVWVYHDAVSSGYALSEEVSRRQRLRRETQQLEVELAAERSPERLARIASDLWLTPATPEQIFGASRPGSGGADGRR